MCKKGYIKGYKVFNPDWTCRKKQYTCPGIFDEDVSPSVCDTGMHFCRRAVDCFSYYSFDPANKAAEVLALGEVDTDGEKSCTNKIQIVREIPWAELLEIVNTGKDCTGLGNTGNYNTGNYNTGTRNTGDCNDGNGNAGNYNTGNRNTGSCNTGDCNNGDWNSGDKNNGDYNSGDQNNGNYNSGDWNKCNYSNGCFNTVEPKIYLFNMPSDWTYRDWLNSNARCLLRQMPDDELEYVWLKDMTEEEKEEHPEAEVTGGYIKKVMVSNEEKQRWWDSLDASAKELVISLPNFDPEIFKEITGIDVNQ